MAQTTAPPAKYFLKLLLMADANPLRFVVTLGNTEAGTVGFESLSSPRLREWVTRYPVGSTIEYAPSCKIMGGEPTQRELASFGAFCKSRRLKFVVIPSG